MDLDQHHGWEWEKWESRVQVRLTNARSGHHLDRAWNAYHQIVQKQNRKMNYLAKYLVFQNLKGDVEKVCGLKWEAIGSDGRIVCPMKDASRKDPRQTPKDQR